MGVESRFARTAAVLGLAVSGDGDECRGSAERRAPQRARNLVAVEPGKTEIDQDDVGALGQSKRHAADSITRLTHVVSLRLEEQPQRLPGVRAVLDDQDPSRPPVSERL